MEPAANVAQVTVVKRIQNREVPWWMRTLSKITNGLDKFAEISGLAPAVICLGFLPDAEYYMYTVGIPTVWLVLGALANKTVAVIDRRFFNR